MNVDGILEKYRSAIDQTLGQGQLDSVLRRASVADALAYGQPSATAVTPRYAPMGQTGGSPVGSSEFLGDLLTQIAHRPSGTPGQSPAPADMAGIYAKRAGNQLAEQGLMDDRAVAEAEMINNAVQEAQGIRGQLGVAGAEAAMGEGRLQAEEQQAVNAMLASFMETETQAGTAAAEREWESEKLLAELAGKKEIAEIGAAGKGGKVPKVLKTTDPDNPANTIETVYNPDGSIASQTSVPKQSPMTPYQEAMVANSTSMALLAQQNAERQAKIDQREADLNAPGPDGGLSRKNRQSLELAKQKKEIEAQEEIASRIDSTLPILTEMQTLIDSGDLTLGPIAGRFTPTVSEAGQRFNQLAADLQVLKTALLKGSTSDRDFAKAIQATVGENYNEGVNLKAIEQMRNEINAVAKRYNVPVPDEGGESRSGTSPDTQSRAERARAKLREAGVPGY